MEKKEKKPGKVPLLLAVISLIIIFVIVAVGTVSGRYRFWLKQDSGSIILGVSQKMEKKLEETFTSTQQGVTEKLLETEGKLKSQLEQEISNLTRSQIESLKLKICQDWGVVITPSP